MARRNNLGVDKEGILGLAAVGAVLGATSTLASSASVTTVGKFVIGTLTGAAVGGVLGAVLSRKRQNNPSLVGTLGAVLASTSMVVAPPVVASKLTAPKPMADPFNRMSPARA